MTSLYAQPESKPVIAVFDDVMHAGVRALSVKDIYLASIQARKKLMRE